MLSFDGKVVFLTGANGAIGRATVNLLAELGATLWLTDLSSASLGGLVEDIRAQGGRAEADGVDVTRSASVDRSLAACAEAFGRIDVLIANAGIFPRGVLSDISDDEWRRTFAINVDGVFHCCRGVTRFMPEGGNILALASIAGHRGSRDHAHYAATKGAVLSLMRSLAWELAPGIRVNCVSPGPVDSPMVAELMQHRGEQVLRGTPQQRLAQPEEVARAIAFMASDWASHITGQTLHVNGGSFIGG
ncbi:SDR family NAD(P)-dependent oxidoreductase [Azospirillum canadense]|uniref:SDR family NAD(P)-dependent oxidoreductase n=1 Tax=Azospirillum canadense TaxID=403962 RepID=UPI0022262775|nr:SDR family NAD(P)-dependent oxidoreductase [Azospirillum canadense]MCW2240506.1 3-oxoacyl-[acyl-carrier protein] reductase [Azospirillum canadense]